MKFFLRFLLAVSLVSGTAFAQLSEDFTAPDFTITDTDGNEHHLYAILDEGKSVILNLFTSSSSICWELLASGVFRDFNDFYGSEGNNSAFVISVESDVYSPLSHLSGGVGSTGNWASIIDYPVADDSEASILTAYGGWPESFVNPAVFVICPDRSVTEIGQGPTNAWGDFWTHEALIEKGNNCPSVSVGLNEGDEEVVSDHKFSVFPNPASSHTTLELSIDEPDDVVIDVVNSLGQKVFVQRSKMNRGLNTVQIPVGSLETGVYHVSIRISDEVYVDKLNVVTN